MKKRIKKLAFLLISSIGMMVLPAINVSAHEHTGGLASCTQQAICDTCGMPYGDVDSYIHLNNAIATSSYHRTCTEDGTINYLCCNDCGVHGANVTYPATGHNDTDNDHYCDNIIYNYHGYYVRNCGEKISDCSGGTATCKDQAICDTCKSPYGEVDSSNHVGDTEVRDAKEATCIEDGYTGDTYCISCDTKLLDGTVIPKDPNKHKDRLGSCISIHAVCTHGAEELKVCTDCKGIINSDIDYEFALGHVDNDNDHYCDRVNGFYNTEIGYIDTAVCGEKISDCSGGTATCKDQAICDTCKSPYGDVDLTNHVGDTEVRDAKEATCEEEGYTGDTYCTSCETKLLDGTVIPKDPNNHKDKGGHDIFIPATCTHDSGIITVCTDCKCIISGVFDDINPLGHIDNDNDHYCDRENYFYNLEIGYIDTAVCGEKISDCSGGTATCKDQAICDTCNKPYGDVDSSNHVGDTEVRNYKYATCTEEGYTGDIYCTSCEIKIEDGTIIPALNHNDTDNDHYCNNKFYNHFEVLTGECGEKISDCSGGTATCKDQAICDTCKSPYGEVDSSNHVGDTEVRDAKEATCEEDGYTGDTYCTSCETKLLDGTIIPALGHGNTEVRDAKEATCEEDGYTGDTYCTSCETKLLDGTIIPALGHKGGTATCKDQAICDTCNKPYGDVDLTNHVGDTEVRDAKEATCEEEGYTGDTYCTSCEIKIEDGTVIPALGHGNTEVRDAKEATCEEDGYTGDTYCTSCEIKIEDGTLIPALGHKGGTATCKDLAICETCNKEYGETDSENHIEDSELRDSKESTCLEEGYSGDVYCKGCETKLQEGTVVEALGHIDDNNDNICDREECKVVIVEPTPTATPEPTPVPTKEPEPTATPIPEPHIQYIDAVKTNDDSPLLGLFALIGISSVAVGGVAVKKITKKK